MFIPVTHPTQCAAECAKCGFSRQANTNWVPLPKWSPIQYGRPNYIGAYVCAKCMSQNLSRACNRVVAYRDCFTHKPFTAHNLVLPDTSALPLGLVLGLAVRWRLNVGYGPMRYPYFSYIEISALLTYWHREFARTQISLRNTNDQHMTANPRAVKALITNAWL